MKNETMELCRGYKTTKKLLIRADVIFGQRSISILTRMAEKLLELCTISRDTVLFSKNSTIATSTFLNICFTPVPDIFRGKVFILRGAQTCKVSFLKRSLDYIQNILLQFYKNRAQEKKIDYTCVS